MLWLVTGCSSGLGLALVEAILGVPDQKVIATSRKPAPPSDAVQQTSSNPSVFWETLDVSSPDLEAQLASITSKHGAINILVNNAGYAMGGAFEALPLAGMRQQYETNLFGPIRIMQSVLPRMRDRQSGTIVNISSAEMWDPHAGASVYASSKWALEGLSEAIAAEVSSFGIRVLLAEPGGMRTSFIDPKKTAEAMVPLPEAYRGTMADYVLQAIVSSHGGQKLDPKRAARAIAQEVIHPTEIDGKKLLRLPLGEECVMSLKRQTARLEKEADAVKELAEACDFD